MSENKNKILVALDGSERAFRTIKYLCSFKPFLKKELVLHNVITKVPECYYDLGKEPFSYKYTSRVRAWEQEYKSQMEQFMAKARVMLISAGFKPDAIRTIIAPRKLGIARDIMEEAKKGYDALLIRRRGGAQKLLPLVLGSVSTKLVQKADCLPVMLAGIQKVNHCLCIANDGSEGARRAIQFVADFIKDTDCRVVLCSVFRDFGNNEEIYTPSVDDLPAEFSRIQSAAEDARQILGKAGIRENHISLKIVPAGHSRAAAIVSAAGEENCDTVVFGRKGRSQVDQFDMGRVPWKVIHGARKLTVWMVP
jgi:nucleotide-binding universal stress UspA family protein